MGKKKRSKKRASGASAKHLALLGKGVPTWNRKRPKHPDLKTAQLARRDLSDVDLSSANLAGADLLGADLSGADLSLANLDGANLFGANLSKAKLYRASLRETQLAAARLGGSFMYGADLSYAHLRGADLDKANLGEADLSDATLRLASLREAYLGEADLSEADVSESNLYRARLDWADLTDADLNEANLVEADLNGAELSGADLRGANLTGAILEHARIVETSVAFADFTRCKVFGAAIWDLDGEPESQDGLVITPDGEPTVTVDNLELAQFIYLIMTNSHLRDVIDTITSKVVLVLGRFTKKRKAVLDAICDELRALDFTPVIFDFRKPASRGYGETVKILASMARFVIADITDAAEVRSELVQIAPQFPSVPIQPLVAASSKPYATFSSDVGRYGSVLSVVEYSSKKRLVSSLKKKVVRPAEDLRMTLI